MVSPSSNITSRGWNLRPKDRRLCTLMSWQPETRKNIHTLSEWTFDLFGFFFSFLIRTLLTCWRAYTFESLHWLISSAAAEGKEKLDDRGNLTTRLQPMAVEEIRFLSMPCHSIQTMVVDTPLSCLKPAGLLCPVVVKTIRWQSEYGWNQILNQNLEKRQFRNSGRKQKQIFPTGHLRTLETRDERGQQ
jgi:hypothetical protein